MEFNETAAREMIVRLATWCERLLIEVNAYRAAVDTCFPDAKEAFNEHAKKAANDPRLREIVAQRYAPCFTCATNGLDNADAQMLLDRIREEMGHAAEQDGATIM
jgi:hypothetical protein